MQLREIHIDGFGIFANKRITGLAPGINIIYGKNEFGKTTLLEFIGGFFSGSPPKGITPTSTPRHREGRWAVA
jgi:uncharacterized protein YhaN